MRRQANNGPTPLPLGTTKGERYRRLILRGATVLSGRGTPGTNRAMPPYREEVLSNADLADIYAYLKSIPKAANPKSIPLLNQ